MKYGRGYRPKMAVCRVLSEEKSCLRRRSDATGEREEQSRLLKELYFVSVKYSVSAPLALAGEQPKAIRMRHATRVPSGEERSEIARIRTPRSVGYSER